MAQAVASEEDKQDSKEVDATVVSKKVADGKLVIDLYDYLNGNLSSADDIHRFNAIIPLILLSKQNREMVTFTTQDSTVITNVFQSILSGNATTYLQPAQCDYIEIPDSSPNSALVSTSTFDSDLATWVLGYDSAGTDDYVWYFYNNKQTKGNFDRYMAVNSRNEVTASQSDLSGATRFKIELESINQINGTIGQFFISYNSSGNSYLGLNDSNQLVSNKSKEDASPFYRITSIVPKGVAFVGSCYFNNNDNIDGYNGKVFTSIYTAILEGKEQVLTNSECVGFCTRMASSGNNCYLYCKKTLNNLEYTGNTLYMSFAAINSFENVKHFSFMLDTTYEYDLNVSGSGKTDTLENIISNLETGAKDGSRACGFNNQNKSYYKEPTKVPLDGGKSLRRQGCVFVYYSGDQTSS